MLLARVLRISVARAGTGQYTYLTTERSEPLVFAIVLNFDSLEDSVACIACLRAATYPALRVLVIDNASPDGSGERLRAQLAKDEFVQLSRNTGYAGGNNAGIRFALERGAEYVLIVNPDVRIPPSAIETYVRTAASNPAIGGINSLQVCEDGVTIDEYFRLGVLADAGVNATKADDPAVPLLCEVKRLYGAALFLTRRAVEAVGGFDPLYFAYGEEIDLCRRLRLHGFKLVVTRDDPVNHLRTKEKTDPSRFVVFLRLKSTYLDRLKDPQVRFSVALRYVVTLFWRDLLRRRDGEYPFSHFEVSRGQVVRAGWWTLSHLPSIYSHRKREIAGRAHV